MERSVSIKQIILYFLFLIICATGDAVAFVAGVGVNPWEAMCQTFHFLIHIKVGTIMAVVNSSTVLIIIYLLKKVHWTMLLQVIASISFGTVVNLIVYLFLADLKLDAYYLRVLLVVLGFVISATGNALMMTCHLAAFPFEGMCEILGEKMHIPFARVRQSFDIFFIILSISLSLLFHVDFAIREGTIISMLIYSNIMGIVMKKAQAKVDCILEK